MDGTMLLAEGGLLEAIGAVVVMVLVVGVKILEKWKQEQERRQATEEAERRRQERARQAASLGSASLSSGAARGVGSAAPVRRAQPVRRAVTAGPASVRRPGQNVRRPVRQPGVAPIILLPQGGAGDAVRVDEELEHEQQRLQQEERERQRRLTELRSEVTGRHVEAVHPHVSAEGFLETAEASERGIGVALDDAASARRAMVLHEIFSPPVALRGDGPGCVL
ncbi:MAG: hypothetical protein GXY74_02620 [Phycisphaerae bacterium]|nr:hypothetical protein [Phycisphaerae bacterium]